MCTVVDLGSKICEAPLLAPLSPVSGNASAAIGMEQLKCAFHIPGVGL